MRTASLKGVAGIGDVADQVECSSVSNIATRSRTFAGKNG